MKTAIILILTLLVPWSVTGAQAGTSVYKWFDEQGRVQYTRHKPLDREWEEVGAPPPPPSMSPDLNKSAGDQIRDAVQASEERQKQAAQAAEKKAEEERIAKDCETARTNIATLTNRPRISYAGKDGEMIIMPEEERAERMKKAKAYIDANCK